MIYTKLTKKAMQIAYAAHHGQTDKVGVPYIFHPMAVAQNMPDEYTTCAALLHDVVEDTAITINDLRQWGIPEEVLSALQLLTHDQSVPYFTYVKAVRQNPIAKAVKLADLAHNSDVSRLDRVDERALLRLEKYREAIRLLTEE